MLGYLAGGIVLIVLGLLPIFTNLSLWWLFLGVPVILFGIVFIIHVFSIRGCWQRILEGDEDAMEQLERRINKIKKIKTK